jgi:hypothetical protein
MKVALAILLVVILLGVVAIRTATSMPGRSHRGALPPLTDAQRMLAASLLADVEALCAVAPRSAFVRDHLAAAAAHVEGRLGTNVERHGDAAANLIVEIPGSSQRDEIVVIGAHYDSIDETIGADDNASGTAALIALAQRFAGMKPARTLRFVAFVNEEPPHFKTGDMGSYRYAKRCSERKEKIVAMLSLEMLGYYDDRAGAQAYPAPLSAFYPSEGNFIAFAGNLDSLGLVRRCVKSFRAHAEFPAEGAALPELIPQIGWSDQWSFWQFGYPGLMVTDTALFRNPHYHRMSDTPETLDYERLARVVEGLEPVIRELTASPPASPR